MAARWIYHAHECALGYRRTNRGVDGRKQKEACHRIPHPRRGARRPSASGGFTASNDEVFWDGVISLWCRSAPLLSPWRARGDVPTGVNLNRYSGSGSHIPWHSDNESLFGPQNQPKLMVSMSLGHSVEFQLRRARCGVPSPIQLDRGDLLVMDGLAQLEYEHRTVSGLQGPRVNLTFRWVTQHIASCPQAGAMYCALPWCVQGLAEPGLPSGENLGIINGFAFGQWSSFCQLGVCLLGHTLLGIRRKRCCSGRRPSHLAVHPFQVVLLAGSGAGVGDCSGGTVIQNAVPLFTSVFLRKIIHVFFFKTWVTWSILCWICQQPSGSPLPCYHDAYSVGTQVGILGEIRADPL